MQRLSCLNDIQTLLQGTVEFNVIFQGTRCTNIQYLIIYLLTLDIINLKPEQLNALLVE